MLFSFTSYLIPNIYYTIAALSRGLSINYIGIILSIFPIGGMTSSFYLGKYIFKVGKRNAIYYGGLILSLSMIFFSFNLIV